jgi:competence protein ComEA
MSKNRLAALLFSCIASLPLAATAAETPKSVASQPEQTVQTADALVNLNTADAAALETGLIGIGPAKAQAIIEHRTSNGPFASIDELLEVKGIGPATLEKNRSRLSVN